MEEMYKRIEELCKERNLNITQLSKRTGIPRSVFSELKSGRTKQLSSKYLSVIADFLGASTDYLLGNVSEPFFYLDNKRTLEEINDTVGAPIKDELIAFYGDVKADLTQDDIDDLMVAMRAKAERNKRRKLGE